MKPAVQILFRRLRSAPLDAGDHVLCGLAKGMIFEGNRQEPALRGNCFVGVILTFSAQP
jgi:hypothetical protein